MNALRLHLYLSWADIHLSLNIAHAQFYSVIDIISKGTGTVYNLVKPNNKDENHSCDDLFLKITQYDFCNFKLNGKVQSDKVWNVGHTIILTLRWTT